MRVGLVLEGNAMRELRFEGVLNRRINYKQ